MKKKCVVFLVVVMCMVLSACQAIENHPVVDGRFQEEMKSEFISVYDNILEEVDARVMGYQMPEAALEDIMAGIEGNKKSINQLEGTQVSQASQIKNLEADLERLQSSLIEEKEGQKVSLNKEKFIENKVSKEEIETHIRTLVLGMYYDLFTEGINERDFEFNDEKKVHVIRYILENQTLEDIEKAFDLNVESKDNFYDEEGKIKDGLLHHLSMQLFNEKVMDLGDHYPPMYSETTPIKVDITEYEEEAQGVVVTFVIKELYENDILKGKVKVHHQPYPRYQDVILSFETLENEETISTPKDESLYFIDNGHIKINDQEESYLIQSGINHKVSYHILDQDVTFIEKIHPIIKIKYDPTSERLYFVTLRPTSKGPKMRSFFVDTATGQLYSIGSGEVIGYLKGERFQDYSVVLSEKNTEKLYNIYNPYGEFIGPLQESLDQIVEDDPWNAALIETIIMS